LKGTKYVTKKQQAIIEPSEVQEQSRLEIITQMLNNARSELRRIAEDRGGLEQLLEDKTHQRGLLLEQRYAADDRYQTMLDERDEAAGRAAREQSRLQIAKGTGAEGEHEAILQSLIADLDAAKQRVESAEKARDAAHERARIVAALDSAISEIHSQMADLAQEQAKMTDLAQEQERAYGVALAEEIKAGIEESKRALKEQEEAMAESKRQYNEATGRIGSLNAWPDLRDQVLMSHGQKREDLDPTKTEQVLDALRSYLLAILDHAAEAQSRLRDGKVKIVDVLAVDTGTIVELAQAGYDQRHGEFARTPQKLDVIDELLREQRRLRSY